MRRLKRWFFILGGLAIGYVALNAALIGGHVWQHRGDRARLQQIAQHLETERGEIGQLEQQLDSLGRKLERDEAGIQQVGFWIRNLESRYPDGIPASLYGEYLAQVGRYNDLIEDYNAIAAQMQALEPGYSDRVDAFNREVEEANALASEVGDVPHLLPVDLPHGTVAIGGARSP